MGVSEPGQAAHVGFESTPDGILVPAGGGGPILDADEQFISGRLTAAGHTVTPWTYSAGGTDLSTTDLVVVGRSVLDIGTTFDAATKGVLSLAAKPHSNFSTSGAPSQGSSSRFAFVRVTPTDPITGADTGSITVKSTNGLQATYTDTSLASGATIVANLGSTTGVNICVARVDTGGTLVGGGTAPSRRTTTGLPAGYSGWTANGLAWFDGAVAWTANHAAPLSILLVVA